MKHFVSLIAALSLLTACQTGGNSANSLSGKATESRPVNLPPKSALSDRQRSELYQAILTAELSEGNDDLNSALTHYLYALTIYPDPEIATEAIVLAQKTQDPAALIQAASVWLEIDPSNKKALEAHILGQLMQFDQFDDLRTQSLNEAYQSTETLKSLFADESSAFNELAGLTRLYLQGSTLTLWRELIRKNPDSPLGWALLADAFIKATQVSDRASFNDEAEQAIEAALRVDGNFQPAINLKIQWLQLQNKPQQITPFLETLLLQNPENASAYSSLAQIYYQNRQYQKAIITINRWQQLEPDNLESIYLKAASYYGNQDFGNAHQIFLELLPENYRPQLTAYYCGDTAERVGKIETAIDCYEKVTEGKYWYPALERWSVLHAKTDDLAPALTRLESLAGDNDPRRAEQSIVLKADLLIQVKRHLEAIEWLARYINHDLTYLEIPVKHFEIMHQLNPGQDWIEYADSIAKRLPKTLAESWFLQIANGLANREKAEQGIALLTHKLSQSPDNLDWKYTRALLRERTGQTALMEQELRELYQLESDNPNVQNALGYTLADLNKELDFAYELIAKAQKALPRSGAVMDSLGWVYYRKGELEKAEKWLKASLQTEASSEVLSHLLEVLVKNDKKDQAEQLLQQFWPSVQNSDDVLSVVKQFQLTTP